MRSRLASSRRSVSSGAERRTAHEKMQKARREEASSHCVFFFFSRADFRAALQLIERLEEASSRLLTHRINYKFMCLSAN